MSRLLQLSLLRHSVAERERYPVIIWLICHIDLYALLSGAGSGEYIRAAVESHLLPGAESLLYPAGVENDRLKYAGECVAQPLITHLYRECFLLAAHLGLFAAEVRASKVPYMEDMHRELQSLRGGIRQLWNSSEARFLMEAQRNLSKRFQHIFQQVSR